MKVPIIVELSGEDMDALVQRVQRGTMQEFDIKIIKAMAETIKFLNSALQDKNISIKRLKNIIFGAKTEKTQAAVNSLQDKKKNGMKGTESGREETEPRHIAGLNGYEGNMAR